MSSTAHTPTLSAGFPAAVVFIDMVGSTAMKADDKFHTHEWRARFQLFYETIRRLVESQHNGRVIKFMGDEAIIRFDEPNSRQRALDCIRNVLNIQGTIGTVKIAADFGEVFSVPGDAIDVLGTPVDRCARISKYVLDGACLVSQPFADGLLADNEKRRVGFASLKGIKGRVQILQLVDARSQVVHLPVDVEDELPTLGSLPTSVGRTLYRFMLQRNARAMTEIANQSLSQVVSPTHFSSEVGQELRRLDPNTDIVLAICGNKGLTPAEEAAYYEMFYEFAERGARVRTDQGIAVCRIFLVDTHGNTVATPPEPKALPMTMHDDHAGVGVRAPRVDPNGLRQSDDFGEIVEWLSAERQFGCIIFIRQDSVWAISHERALDAQSLPAAEGSHRIRMTRHEAPGNVLGLFELFDRLLRRARWRHENCAGVEWDDLRRKAYRAFREVTLPLP